MFTAITRYIYRLQDIKGARNPNGFVDKRVDVYDWGVQPEGIGAPLTWVPIIGDL